MNPAPITIASLWGIAPTVKGSVAHGGSDELSRIERDSPEINWCDPVTDPGGARACLLHVLVEEI